MYRKPKYFSCAPNLTVLSDDLNQEKFAATVASSIWLSLFNPFEPPNPNSVKNKLFAYKNFPILETTYKNSIGGREDKNKGISELDINNYWRGRK